MARVRREGERACSVDGCDSAVLARGWCTKHYSRWRTKGDPLYLAPRLKGDPNAPVQSSRFIRGERVYFTEDGRCFVEIRRLRSGEVVVGRRYGWVFTCENCKKEAFAKGSGTNRRLRFCSHKCAGPASSKAKLGKVKTTGQRARVAHLDRLFSVLVRSDGKCENCGATDLLQCAHGFSRRYRSVRWDFRNAFCLCARCHMYYTHRPLEWDEWLIGRWGSDLYGEIRRLALSTDKADMEAVRVSLVAETQARGVTAHQLPKSISGWIGLRNEPDGDAA